jgi:hypothetical protein
MSADKTGTAYRLLRLVADKANISPWVHQGSDGWQIEASQDGQTIRLKGERLEPLVKELARKVGYGLDGAGRR